MFIHSCFYSLRNICMYLHHMPECSQCCIGFRFYMLEVCVSGIYLLLTVWLCSNRHLYTSVLKYRTVPGTVLSTCSAVPGSKGQRVHLFTCILTLEYCSVHVTAPVSIYPACTMPAVSPLRQPPVSTPVRVPRYTPRSKAEGKAERETPFTRDNTTKA